MAKVFLTTAPIHDFSDVAFGPGEAVQIIAPRGYRWRPIGHNRIAVFPCWWRRLLDGVNSFHVLMAFSFLGGVILSLWRD